MNKLPWFTHDHDAHADGWIRNLVRKQGHVAGWIWWVLIELHHKHGVGDVLKRDITDIANDSMTSTSVVVRVLTEMATEYEGQTKVRYNLVGTELELEIKKLRERQSKLKSKIPATFRQPSANLPIERERERERQPPISPMNGGPALASFESIFSQYPKTDGYEEGRLVWAGMSPTEHEIVAIRSSLVAWMGSEDWRKEGGRYVTRLDNWLKNRQWEKLPRECGQSDDQAIIQGPPR